MTTQTPSGRSPRASGGDADRARTGGGDEARAASGTRGGAGAHTADGTKARTGGDPRGGTGARTASNTGARTASSAGARTGGDTRGDAGSRSEGAARTHAGAGIRVGRPPRADAERNRRRILDAATRVFAERGPTATLHDVARAAGVGVGTVYRNFPDRERLLDALFDDKVETFMRPAVDAQEIADPGEAFRSYLLGMLAVHAADKSLATVLFAPHRQARFPQDAAMRLEGITTGIIEAAITAGELRAGFTRQDTVAFGIMIGEVAAATRRLDPQLWRRYAQVIVDGTRPQASTAPLPPDRTPFPAVPEALIRAR